MKDWDPYANPTLEHMREIRRPPCEGCKFFMPQVVWSHSEREPRFFGIRVCHANEMEHDFSCFKPIHKIG